MKTSQPNQKEQSAQLKSEENQSEGFSLQPPTFSLKADPLSPPADNGGNGNGNPTQLKSGNDAAAAQQNGGANGLPGEVQGKMEQTLGADFSNVNIETNSAQAKDMGALAYTQGNDVHFAPGQFKPDTQSGQELIGHELTHVVQQRQGRVQPNTEINGKAVNDDTSLEQEADNLGAKAAQTKLDDSSTQLKKEEGAADSGVTQAKLEVVQHKADCGCGDCVAQMKREGAPIQRTPEDEAGESETEGGESATETEVSYEPTYVGKDFVTSKDAKLNTQGLDDHGVETFAGEQGQIAEKYEFGEGAVPQGAVVELVKEAVSQDTSRRSKAVAQIRIVSIPEGSAQDLVGQTVWTTRTNVSAEANESGQYSVTDRNATIRLEPTPILGDKFIPRGTTIQVLDTIGVDDFPEDFRLDNSAERNSFHANRYMRLWLQASYVNSSGETVTGWISADDVVGGFANEVLGVAGIPEGSLESDDPSHMTVGVLNGAPMMSKGGMTYAWRKPYVIIAQGTYVRINSVSEDGKVINVSSEDGSVSNQWTSKDNIDESKTEKVGPEGAEITYYEVTNGNARIQDESQGWSETGTDLAFGDFVKVHAAEDNYLQIAKVNRVGEERVEEDAKHWVEAAYLAPGWSTDLKGTNASWGVEVIGGRRLTKYKGQDELVNLGGSGGKMKQVSKTAYPNLIRMIRDAQANEGADGSADPVGIEINSCFRAFFSQKYFKDNEDEDGFNDAASPGRSDHQDSNAFDLNNRSDPKVYTWLKNNAWKYDIVQNVQKSNEKHHWAYLPGQGVEGQYTTWGTKSTQSW